MAAVTGDERRAGRSLCRPCPLSDLSPDWSIVKGLERTKRGWTASTFPHSDSSQTPSTPATSQSQRLPLPSSLSGSSSTLRLTLQFEAVGLSMSYEVVTGADVDFFFSLPPSLR